MKRYLLFLASLLLYMFIANAAFAASYQLGPGDTIEVMFPLAGSLQKQQVTIQPDGQASIYPLGTTQLEGLSVEELENKLKQVLTPRDLPQTAPRVRSKKARRQHENPVSPTFAPSPFIAVSVNVVKPRPALVYVMGDVASPGVLQVEQGDNQPVLTVANVLSKNGGVMPTSDIQRVEVHHKQSGTVETIDLLSLLENPSQEDVALQPGDKIVVPKSRYLNYEVFDRFSRSNLYSQGVPVLVFGDVTRQGLVQLKPDEAFLHTALALAGGYSPAASKRKVYLSHQANYRQSIDVPKAQRKAQNVQEELINPRTMNPSLKPYDVIYVPRSGLASLGSFSRFVSRAAASYFNIAVGTRYEAPHNTSSDVTTGGLGGTTKSGISGATK